MPQPPHRPRPASRPARSAALTGRQLLALLLVLCLALLSYGSFYPFNFTVPDSLAGDVQALLADRTLYTSRGDVLGNIALFLPVGVLAMAAAAPRRHRLACAVAIVVAGTAFAFLVQLLQVFFPPRAPSMADTVWNGAGTLLGVLAAPTFGAWAARFHTPEAPVAPQRWAAGGLVALWVLTQLFPLVPSLDWQLLKDHLKAVLADPWPAPVATLFTLARVMAVGCLLAAVWQRAPATPRRFALLLALLLAGKLFIDGQRIASHQLLGFPLGFLLWWGLWSRRPARMDLAVLFVLLAGYTLEALSPFELAPVPSELHVLPFAALLEGSMLVNTWSMTESFFVYGALLWLAQRERMPLRASCLTLAAWVGLLELAQCWIAGRTADLTSVLLVLALGGAMHLFAARGRR